MNPFRWFFKNKKRAPAQPSLTPIARVVNIQKAPLDVRDHIHVTLPSFQLPIAVDHSHYYKPKDQGTIGACSCYAATNGLEYLDQVNHPEKGVDLSELYLYWIVRKDYENTYPLDTGAHGRNVMQALKDVGNIPEYWYPESKDFNAGPSNQLFATWVAHFWKITSYQRCYDVDTIKTAVAQGKPVWIGIPVQQAIFTLPKNQALNYAPDQDVKGGHAMLIVGYNDALQAFRVVNSWGTGWADKGFGLISYSYLVDAPWTDAWSYK